VSSLFDPASGTALHPDDRETDESGPWVALLVGSVVAWVCLVGFESALLETGTFLWATVRSAATLVFAPVAAASLLQDTRALETRGTELGRVKWLYAGVALVFPPASVVYLGHRWVVHTPPEASDEGGAVEDAEETET
jgi:hypothetical protein